VTVAETVALRVTVLDTWDTVRLDVEQAVTVAEVKRRALAAAMGRTVNADDYVVKYHGASVLDERETVAGLALADGAPLIVLPGRRHPVR
jgi:hypothetical protein